MPRDALYELPIFEGITEAELEWLLPNSIQFQLDKGEFFTKEHDPIVRFYVVLEGELQVSRVFNGTPRGAGYNAARHHRR